MATKSDQPETQTQDNLQNLVTALGTSQDKAMHNRFIYQYVSWMELGAAYRENWLARAVIDVPVQDSLREWRTWAPEYAEEMEKEERRLHVKWHFSQALKWARLYGGAGIVMICPDYPLDEPLDPESVKKGAIERLVTLDRWELAPVGIDMNRYDRLDEHYYIPEFYTVRGGTQLVHRSHMVRVEGATLPPQLMRFEQGWGDSEMRKCFADIKDCVSMKMGIASLIQEANVDIIKRQGLADALSTGQEEAIKKRYQLFNQMKSNVNMGLLDATEDFERKEINFSGLSSIMEMFFTWMSGASGIPMTRLFGTSAKGMSATGEGDEKTYFNDIRSRQENQYRYWLEPLDTVMARSVLGSVPDELYYNWNPLYQQSGLELQTSMLSKAQRDEILLQAGVINEAQVAKAWQRENLYEIDQEWIDRLEAGVKSEDLKFEVPDEPAPAPGGPGETTGSKPHAAQQAKSDKPGVNPRDMKAKGKSGQGI
jgi:phage-related protein (TIGR01555 family)